MAFSNSLEPQYSSHVIYALKLVCGWCWLGWQVGYWMDGWKDGWMEVDSLFFSFFALFSLLPRWLYQKQNCSTREIHTTAVVVAQLRTYTYTQTSKPYIYIYYLLSLVIA